MPWGGQGNVYNFSLSFRIQSDVPWVVLKFMCATINTHQVQEEKTLSCHQNRLSSAGQRDKAPPLGGNGQAGRQAGISQSVGHKGPCLVQKAGLTE